MDHPFSGALVQQRQPRHLAEVCKLCEQLTNSRRGPGPLPKPRAAAAGEAEFQQQPDLGEAAVAFSPAKQAQFFLPMATLPVNRGKQHPSVMGS